MAWGVGADEICEAHSHGVKVIMPNPQVVLTSNITERELWIENTVSQIVERGLDGITFDYESPISASSNLGEYYTELIKGTTTALHKISTSYQVSVCVAWSPDSIDGRSYPIKDLADASDALYVMDYDTRSQVFDACLASANAPYPGMIHGIQRYLDIGVQPDKLILGVPWYGYHYPCLPGTDKNSAGLFTTISASSSKIISIFFDSEIFSINLFFSISRPCNMWPKIGLHLLWHAG